MDRISLVFYSILLAIEVLIVAVLLSNAFPPELTPLVKNAFLAREQNNITPKRDLLLYVFFGFICFAVYIGLFILSYKRGQNEQWFKRLKTMSYAQAFWVVLELYAAFKMMVFHSPLWAQVLLYCSLAASFAHKIFWPEWSGLVKKFWPQAQQMSITIFKGRQGPLIAAAILIGIIYIPNPQAVVAQLYIGDQFHNWDISCMGSVWGLFNGLLPDVHVYSQYGFGIPVLMTGLMKFLGGFDYVNALKALVWLGIIYYVGWFFILRKWFYSGLVAFAAIIFGIKIQMFPTTVIPTVWNPMAESVLRFFFDVAFFAALYKHMTTGKKIFLWMAAGVAGVGLYYMMSTGSGLFFALLAYIVACCLIPEIRSKLVPAKKDYWTLAGIVALAPVVTVGLVLLTIKGHAFKQTFWHNLSEFHGLFASGYCAAPLTSALDRKEFLLVAIGLGIVLFYIGSMLYAVNQVYFKKADHKILLAVPLGAYGLGLHAYYIALYMGFANFILPAIFLLYFWIDYGCRQAPLLRQQQIRIIVAVASCCALISTPMYTAYPNVFNLSRNPIVDPNVAVKLDNGGFYFNQLYVDFPESLKLPVNSLGEKDEQLKFEKDFQTDKQLVEYYKQDTDFSKDADLIRRLTPEGSRVPLIASFEVLFLSQAKRKPFFYHFPYLSSRMLRTKSFVTSTLWSYAQIKHMIDEIEESKPEYIFMQRIFLTPEVPAWYGYQFEDLILLIRHVQAHYQPEQVGQFLVAMKRVR